MWPVSTIRARRLEGAVAARRKLDEKLGGDPQRIAAYQLERFNELWRESLCERPCFADLTDGARLPRRFESWDEVRDRLPSMDRSTLQKRGDRLRDPRRPAETTVSTGGSTSEPIQIGKWSSEASVAAGDIWFARSWLGIRPDDRLFLLWGHSHLLGRGLSGAVTRVVRNAKDAALGYRRFSAYDLSETALAAAGRAPLRHRPRWVLGYSVALDLFARANRQHRESFRRLGLAAVIATGEGFPHADCAREIESVLGCPVAMEYGTVETGPLAHEHPAGGFRVLWQHYYCELLEADGDDAARELAVTALFPRATPLVRYRVGDRVLGASKSSPPILEISEVIGRTNDFILTGDGAKIHSEVFSHAVREETAIEAFHVRQAADGKLALSYVGEELGSAGEVRVRDRLGRVHPELAGLVLRRESALPQTVAGKTRSIAREANARRPGHGA